MSLRSNTAVGNARSCLAPPPLDAISSIKIVIRLSNHLSAATVSADLAIDAEVDLPALASPLIVRSRRPVR